MPILNLQRSFAEVGRIRLGEQVATGKGGTRPAKLGTFRLTSPDKTRIDAAAQLYGGTPAEWQAPAGKQWEVITEAETIPVLVPPVADMTFTQWYELWSGGGCLRRCDTQTVTFNDKGAMQEGPCLCDADARECKPHSRLSILLPELPGLGVWRLDTQGYYAARELGYSVENIIALYARRGDLLPATLRLDQRMIKRPGKQTVRFVVPVLDVNESPNELLRRRSLPASEQAAIEAKSNAAPLTPVPDDGEPVPSIAEQTAAVDSLPGPKRRTAKAVAATGVAVRTAQQVKQTQQTDAVEPSEPPPDADTPPLDEDTMAQRRLAAIQSVDRVEDRREKTGLNVIPYEPSAPPEPDIVDAEEVTVDECPICQSGEKVCPHHGEAPPDETDTPTPPADEPEQLDMLATPAEPEPETESKSVALISAQQLKDLSSLMRDAGFADKQSRQSFVISVISRDVATAQDLTEDEAAMVISAFKNNTHVAARHKLDMLLRAAGFDDNESQAGFITAIVRRDSDLAGLTSLDEITSVTSILESDNADA